MTDTTNNEVTRPEWLPEKFSSPQDLAKAYGELEKKLGAGTTPADSQASLGIPKPTPEPENFDLSVFYGEYEANGGLSNESYQKLASKGLNRQFVDSYIEGQKAVAMATIQTVHAVAGGTEQYKKMVEWAAQALSPAEIDAYDRSVGGSPEVAKLAVQGLQARYLQAMGGDPSLLSGGASGVSGAASFQSRDEYHNALRDPRYGKDRVYTQQVDDRLKRSTYMTRK